MSSGTHKHQLYVSVFVMHVTSNNDVPGVEKDETSINFSGIRLTLSITAHECYKKHNERHLISHELWCYGFIFISCHELWLQMAVAGGSDTGPQPRQPQSCGEDLWHQNSRVCELHSDP